MSTTIDEKVVEMRFDNKNFESNVRETMSTLDKFKQKLNLTGASKGLENINNVANKVDMSGMTSAIQTVQSKFSAMEVVGITVLSNITNSAFNAGKQLVKSLTIDQVAAGWDKYAQKTASVQTIMNSTGKSIDEVNEYLDQLMWFSDETSYGFTDMTSALAQMTSAGGDIEKLIPLITGVANATAFAGKGAKEFSHVMYNLNQSYSKGYLDYMDWKSIDLMGASSKQLKQILIDTAVEMGKLKEGQVTVNNMANTLKDKWADTEVMEKAFGKFSELSQAAYKAVKAGEYDTASEAIEALADKYSEIGSQAFRSAQEAKSFSEAIDATKDAVSSSFMRISETIFGNYVEAKKLWTDLANTLYDFFVTPIDNIQSKIEEALRYNPFSAILKKIDDSGIGKVVKKVNNVTKSLESYQKMVNKIWRGDYNNRGDNPDRYDLLAKEGWNPQLLQSLVNKGYKYKLTVDDITKAEEKYGVATKEVVETVTELTDAQLKDIGLTDEEIRMYRQLEDQSKKTGKSIDEIVKSMSQKDGRTLLIDSFKNFGAALGSIFKSIGDAWKNAFPPMTALQIYNIIDGFNKFSNTIKTKVIKNADKLTRTLKGLFAIIDIITTFVGSGFKLVFTIIKTVLGVFNLNILDFTAIVGDAIVAVRDWIEEHNFLVKGIEIVTLFIKNVVESISDWISKNIDLTKGLSKVKDWLTTITTKIKDWVSKNIDLSKGLDGFKTILSNVSNNIIKWIRNNETLSKGLDFIKDILGKVSEKVKEWINNNKILSDGLKNVKEVIKKVSDAINGWIKGLKETDNIPKYIIEGLANGLKNGAKAVIDSVIQLGKNIIEWFCKVLGIHSPSTEFFEIGQNIIQGLVNGIKSGFSMVVDVFKQLFATGNKIDWNGFASIITFITTLVPGLSKLNIGAAFARMMQSIGADSANGLINGLKDGFGKVFGVIIEIGKNIIDWFCGILGIHSPSKVFFTIGGFIIAGLVLGIQNGIPEVQERLKGLGSVLYDTVTSIIKKVIDIIKSLDVGTIFTIAIGSGFAFGIVKIAKALEILTKPLLSISGLIGKCSKVVETFDKSLEKISKSVALGIKAKAIKDIAISIGILAASVAVLALLDVKKVWSSVGVIAVLIGLLAALSFAVGKFGAGENNVDFAKVALTLLGFAVVLKVMSKVLKTISGLEPESLKRAIISIGFLSTMIVGLMWATKLISGSKNVDKIGKTLIQISGALLIMSWIVKILGGMNPEKLVQGIKAISAFSLIIVGLMYATKLINGSRNIDSVGKTLFKIAGAILVMAVVAKMLGKMNPDQLKQGIKVIVIFEVMIIALMAATKLLTGSTNVDKFGKAILGVAGAFLAMGLVVKLLGGMEVEQLKKGIVAVGFLGAIIAGLMWATKLIGGKDLTKLGGTILSVSVAILILAGAVALLSLIDEEGLKRGLAAVTVLSIMMAVLINATKNAKQFMGTMIAITVAIGILCVSLGLLSLIEPEKLLASAFALSAVLLMLNIVIRATGQAKDCLGTIIVITVAIGILAGALYLLAQLPTDQALAASGALSLVMISMAGVMLAISKLGGLSAKALIGIVGMLALVGILYLVIGALALMQNIQNASQNAIILAAFMGVLAIVQLLCAAAGAIYAATGGIAALGLVGMLGLIASLYLIIGALAVMSMVPNAISNLEALKSFMITMTAILVVLAIIGPFALVGVTAMAALTLLMGAIGVFAVSIGALMQKFPALQSFLDTGLPVLIQLAGAIGEMIGAFVNGILTQIASGLPEIGMCLGLFMVNLMPFIMGAKMIDGSVLSGVGILAASILALTAAQLIEGITSFLMGGNSFAQLGTELSMFIMNAMPFIMLSKQIDPAIMTGIKALAEAVLILTANDILQGITSWLTGGNSLEKFAAQLPILGMGLNGFITALGPVTEDQVKTAQNAASIIKTLAGAAKEIPNTGGFLAQLVGDNDMTQWAIQLPIVAAGIAGFVRIISENKIDSKAVETANSAAEVIKSLASAAKEIPNTGGFLAQLVGDNDLGTFASQFPNVGKGIVGFINAMTQGKVTKESAETANTAAEVIKTLAGAAKTVPNTGGFLAQLVGDNDLSKFASELPNVGKGIAGFANELGEFGKSKLDTINTASIAMLSIAKLANIDIKSIGSGIGSFSKNMTDFAKKIKEFVDSIGEINGDNISAAINKIRDLINMLKDISGTDISSLNTMGDSLKKFANDGVNGFVNEFSGNDPKTKVANAIKDMINALINGAESKKNDVQNKFKEIAQKASDGLKDSSVKDKATQSGKDLCQGLINGLQDPGKLSAVYNAAYALGQKAVQGEKDGQKSNSPSKATIQAGKWLGEGLVIGIKNMNNKVYKAGRSMGEEATDSISNALNTALSLLNSDMDMQPTIRPVLDLSDVESGAGYLSSMFNNGPSIGVMSNLRAISSGMNGRNQNGTNDDVVSAINKLSKDLGNIGGNTYNVNGVTYDDGSNITEAVKTLIRAAKVERRN